MVERLIEFTTTSFSFVVEGPRTPTSGVLNPGNAHVPGYLRIELAHGETLMSAKYLTPDGDEVDWHGHDGPVLFENTRYKVTISLRDRRGELRILPVSYT